MGAFEIKDDVTQSMMVAKKRWKTVRNFKAESNRTGDSLDMRDKRKPGIKKRLPNFLQYQTCLYFEYIADVE